VAKPIKIKFQESQSIAVRRRLIQVWVDKGNGALYYFYGEGMGLRHVTGDLDRMDIFERICKAEYVEIYLESLSGATM